MDVDIRFRIYSTDVDIWYLFIFIFYLLGMSTSGCLTFFIYGCWHSILFSQLDLHIQCYASIFFLFTTESPHAMLEARLINVKLDKHVEAIEHALTVLLKALTKRQVCMGRSI